MVKIESLSDEQRRALLALRRRAVGRVALRAQMVLLSARGYSVAQIAELFEVGADVVRTWLHRYQQQGARGLEDRPRPGRPPKDGLARHIVDAQARNPPCYSGLVQTCWPVGLLAAFLAARFRLGLSPSSVRRYLKRRGWRGARPRLAPATHALGRQKKVDAAAATKLARSTEALASAATVLYLDESELQLRPVVRAMWMKGKRVRVPTPGQNATRVLFGALNAHTGTLAHRVRPRKRAVDFVAFLDYLAQCYPSGEVGLVLDNVITHDAKLGRAWLARPAHARFRVLWLPKYAAHEHNPIERVWGLVKDHVAANRLYGSIDTLVATAERYLRETSFPAPSRDPCPATTAVAA
jgi:transposase